MINYELRTTNYLVGRFSLSIKLMAVCICKKVGRYLEVAQYGEDS